MRVLIVDDSSVFRTQIRKALTDVPGIDIAGTASNGRIALQMMQQKSVDLVTLDLNMPDMGGLETLREIRKAGRRIHVIVFASRSARSAEETIDALSNGADDFVLKPDGNTSSLEHALEQVRSELVKRVKQFSNGPKAATSGTKQTAVAKRVERFSTEIRPPSAPPKVFRRHSLQQFKPMIIVIASSTGGPNALEVVLTKIPKLTRVPILIAQHMPATFTKYLAKRLQESIGITCREALNGELIRSDTIYIAPGDFHMRVATSTRGNAIILDQGPKLHSVRPAADHLFNSAADLYGSACFGMVLTGMGEDGLVGAIHIKERGGAIMIQNQESCAVWGMPAAVYHAEAYDAIGNLDECGSLLARLCA